MEAPDILLLKKFLERNCTEGELRKVKELLSDPEAKQVLDGLMAAQHSAEWYSSLEADPFLQGKVTDMRVQVRERIAASEKPPVRMYFARYAAVWAGVLVIAGLAIWQAKKQRRPEVPVIASSERFNSSDIPILCQLPDSSQVYLGKGGRLKYPVRFMGKTREIELAGEAFFLVKQDPVRPFIVHTGRVQTKVLGTSFKVEAFADRPLMVAVATGKVVVSDPANGHVRELALLIPGQRVTWNSRTGQLIKDTVDVYGLEEWRTGELVFNRESFWQIAEELKRRYHIDIDFIDKDIAGSRVSGTFPVGKPIEKIIETLAIAGKFRYTTTDHQRYKIYKLK